MSQRTIYICDRCQKEFNPYRGKLVGISGYPDMEIANYDLCEKCYEEVKIFLNLSTNPT